VIETRVGITVRCPCAPRVITDASVAGKSELLQTLIAALNAHRTQRALVSLSAELTRPRGRVRG
jgi:hypothetical protein